MTKKVLLLTLCLTVFSGLCGCWNAGRGDRGIGVSIEEDGQFPEFLVGTWRPNESRWLLTFEADGRISKMRHFGGMEIDVAEGGLWEQWRDNIEALYVLGPCEARYNTETRELSVTIVIEEFIISSPNDSLEGSFHDYLTGRVSEDGTTWKANWTSTSEIIGSGSGTVGPKQLTFTKVTGEVTD